MRTPLVAVLCSFVLIATSSAAQGNPRKDRPPTVAITSPITGTTYTSARTVTIAAVASDDRGVTKVEFFDGGVSAGVDVATPYTLDWVVTAAQNGAHTWSATATDTAGHRTTTALTITLTVAIAVDPGPTPTWTLCAQENERCTFTGTRDVRYGANGAYATKTFIDGTMCSNDIFGDPLYGAAKHCDVRDATTPTPTPTPTGRGPQATITCPGGAISITVGSSIQAAVTANPAATTFCLKAGVHTVSSSVTPKSGDVFVGEYGAILDGTGWATTESSAAAFRAHNEDIDDVTIRNLVIRHMPWRGIHAFQWMSDRWTIENNEITANKYGLNAPNASLVRNNYIHHNVGDPNGAPADRGGGYGCYQCIGTTFENNEIAYNGAEEKVAGTTNVIFRNNFVHHNLGDGIWYDGDNTGALVEGNLAEDNGGSGIFYEISGRGVIRNNVLRRNEGNALFISTSRDVDISGNTFEQNFRAIVYFLNCAALGSAGYPGSIDHDLVNVLAHDNTITIGTMSGAFANGIGYISCSDAQVAPYLGGLKNLTFARNAYTVPSITGAYWLWNGLKSWTQWQAVPQDAGGMVK